MVSTKEPWYSTDNKNEKSKSIKSNNQNKLNIETIKNIKELSKNKENTNELTNNIKGRKFINIFILIKV